MRAFQSRFDSNFEKKKNSEQVILKDKIISSEVIIDILPEK